MSRRFFKPVVTNQADFHAASPSERQLACQREAVIRAGEGVCRRCLENSANHPFATGKRSSRDHGLTAPNSTNKGRQNVRFRSLRAIFRSASANSTNKGQRDNGTVNSYIAKSGIIFLQWKCVPVSPPLAAKSPLFSLEAKCSRTLVCDCWRVQTG